MERMREEGPCLIGFDLGWTLIDNPGRVAAYLAYLRARDLPLPSREQVERAFHLVDKRFMREFPGVLGRHPSTWLPWYLGMVNEELGLHIDMTQQLRDLAGLRIDWELYPWTLPTLEELRRRGYPLVLVSNWGPDGRALVERLGLAHYFRRIYISAEWGIEKPDPRLFRRVLLDAGVAGAGFLYVGDNYYDDVVGARSVGAKAVLLNRFDRLGVEEVNDCLVIHDLRQLLDLLPAPQGSASDAPAPEAGQREAG
ncbi:MAG: HAD family hydrolase [Bacillota bacterium]|nr:HAD family hydrolase [Bacillota bacterium]MDI3316557.1 HAD family hydrolase [Bacillota bacterium]